MTSSRRTKRHRDEDAAYRRDLKAGRIARDLWEAVEVEVKLGLLRDLERATEPPRPKVP